MATIKTHPPQQAGSGNAWVNPLYEYLQPVGNIFYVCSTVSGASNASGYGRSPESPFATLDYAIGLCNADSNDVIIVMATHVETITGAAGVAVDVAGITIIGMGEGRQRPRINYTTAAAASFDITAARCVIKNLYFTPIGVDAVTAAINISGADVVIDGIEMELADATNQAVLGILTAATATRLIVKNSYFHGSGDAGTAAAIRHASGNDVQIIDNVFFGNYTTTLGAIDNSAAVTGLQIHRNKIANNTASAAKAFVAHGSTTGAFSENLMGVLTGTAPVTAAAMNNLGGGYYSAAAGVTAATLI